MALGGVVGALPAPLPSVVGGLPLLGSVLGGGSSPSPSIPPSTPTPANPPPPPPSTPSPSPSTPPPSTPPPSTPPSNPPPSPSNPPPSPPNNPPSPSNNPPSPSNPPPLNNPPSNPPPSTPSTPSPPPSNSSPPPSNSSPPPSNSSPLPSNSSPPPSNSSPPQPSPAHLQSPNNPTSNGGSPSPSTDSPSFGGGSSPSPSDNSSPSPTRGSPPSDGSNSASPLQAFSPSDSGGPSSDGGAPLPLSTNQPGTLSSPSTQNGPSPSTNGFVLSANSISSSIEGDSLVPQTTNVATDSSPLPDTISTQSAVVISGSTSRSIATAPRINNVGSTSISSSHTISISDISGSPSHINNPTSTIGPNGGGPTSISSALADPQHQLTPGEIVAIVVAVLVFFITIPIAVYILRRRSEIHRADRSTRWWFATTRSSQLYGDDTTERLIPPGTQTARSSFGTTVDQSESTHPTHDTPTYVIPSFPTPVAEVGRGNASRRPLVINLEGSSNSNLVENRQSIASVGSDQSQYLIVAQRNSANSDLQVATPMSVRPFSPSESFAFPKPPEPVAGSVVIGSSRPTSFGTSVTLASPPLPPGLSYAPSSFMPLVAPNTTKTPNITKSPSSTADPFEDPTTSAIDNSPYSDIPIQAVHRPFEPTLPDELVVHLGDGVRVLHTFDDGWGLIERVGRDGREDERGLIPMACLMKPGEESEEMRPESRSSSFEGPCAY